MRLWTYSAFDLQLKINKLNMIIDRLTFSGKYVTNVPDENEIIHRKRGSIGEFQWTHRKVAK